MHVLVTGASSFVGHHLIRDVLQAGHRVTATYRKTNAAVADLSATFRQNNLRLVELDLADRSRYRLLPAAMDAVIHVAGISEARGASTEQILACNVDGTRNLILHALAAGAGKFIFTSTLSVHGEVSSPVIDENTPVLNPHVYGASKYLAERMLAAQADRMPSIAVRLPGVLGIGAHTARLPVFLEKMRSGETITIYNPQANFNNAVHVDDLGRFFNELIRRQWQGFFAFPIAADGMTTVREAVERMKVAAQSTATISIDPVSRPAFVISSKRATTLGYRPTDINVMIDRFVAETRAIVLA